jgi:hypothetical protein
VVTEREKSMRPMRISIVSETFVPQVNGVSRTLDRLVHCWMTSSQTAD